MIAAEFARMSILKKGLFTELTVHSLIFNGLVRFDRVINRILHYIVYQ